MDLALDDIITQQRGSRGRGGGARGRGRGRGRGGFRGGGGGGLGFTRVSVFALFCFDCSFFRRRAAFQAVHGVVVAAVAYRHASVVLVVLASAQLRQKYRSRISTLASRMMTYRFVISSLE